jgi:hypothetical protein
MHDIHACALVGLLAIVGCGGASAPSSEPEKSTDQSPLAADVDALDVVRVASIPQNDPGPFSATATDAAKVRALDAELRALPAVGSGPVNCPADWGIRYTLTFRRGDVVVETWSLDDAGCQFASGPNGARWALGSNDGIWSDLASAVGAPVASLHPIAPKPVSP